MACGTTDIGYYLLIESRGLQQAMITYREGQRATYSLQGGV